MYTVTVRGPLAEPPLHMMRLTVFDESGNECAPSDVLIRWHAEGAGDNFPPVIVPTGQKQEGGHIWSEYGPLSNPTAVYTAQLMDADNNELSPIAKCDNKLPPIDWQALIGRDGKTEQQARDSSAGQVHAWFEIHAHPDGMPPPPPPPAMPYLRGQYEGPICDGTFAAYLYTVDGMGQPCDYAGLSIDVWMFKSGAWTLQGQAVHKSVGTYEFAPMWLELRDWRNGEYPRGLVLFQPMLGGASIGQALVHDASLPFVDEAACIDCLPQDDGQNWKRHHRLACNCTWSPEPLPAPDTCPELEAALRGQRDRLVALSGLETTTSAAKQSSISDAIADIDAVLP